MINQNTGTNTFETKEEFKYLGTMISNNKEQTELQTRITAENKTYYALLEIMKSRYVHKKTTFRVYKTIRTIVFYGFGTWVVNNKIELASGVFEIKVQAYWSNKCLRTMENKI